MADQELHETDADAQDSGQQKSAAEQQTTDSQVSEHTESEHDTALDTDDSEDSEDTDATDNNDSTEDTDEDENYGVSMDKVQAVLNQTVDKDALTPQMKRMIQRQEENTKRVEESIKGTKANSSWFVPVMCAFMIIGVIWCVVYYLNSGYPIPSIGAWNLAIGFGLIMIGFFMTMAWR
ncbi:cell division protein CrgA [Bifidobacterium aquikefiri]|uniref:cell division protein CrgA n=1 Tax=Bifidobacterium aquikefiri TaxID=1653207 RepID=UPI0039EC383E